MSKPKLVSRIMRDNNSRARESSFDNETYKLYRGKEEKNRIIARLQKRVVKVNSGSINRWMVQTHMYFESFGTNWDRSELEEFLFCAEKAMPSLLLEVDRLKLEVSQLKQELEKCRTSRQHRTK